MALNQAITLSNGPGYLNFTEVVPVDESSLFHRFTAATAILESLAVAALHFCDDDIYKRFDLNEKLFTEFQTYCPGKVVDSLQVREFMENRQEGKEYTEEGEHDRNVRKN